MASRALEIIKALYGPELREAQNEGWLSLFGIRKNNSGRPDGQDAIELYDGPRFTISRNQLILLAVIVFIAAHAILSVFYYNQFTRGQMKVEEALANIGVLMQRRRDISVNFARTVRDYAVHERAVFENVSKMRNAARQAKPGETKEAPVSPSVAHPATQQLLAAAAGDNKTSALIGAVNLAAETLKSKEGVDSLLKAFDEVISGKVPADKQLSGMLALAEQYPSLQLSENFRQFMDSLVQTEKDLAAARMKHSQLVNAYTTTLKIFPGNVFAYIYCFKPLPYFEPDKEARSFLPVEY